MENGQDQETSLAVGMMPATPFWPLITAGGEGDPYQGKERTKSPQSLKIDTKVPGEDREITLFKTLTWKT
jgi:hypothetical protein